MLIQTPDGRNVLVDAGDGDSAEDTVAYLKRCAVRRIDLLVITHPHIDHIGGLPRILEEFGVSEVVDTGCPHGSRTYREVLSSIEERRIGYRLAAESPSLHISKNVGFQIIWPPKDYAPSGDSELNDASIVMRVAYKDVSVLLTGDIQLEAEGRILADNPDLQCTILKIAHHGSAGSTSNELLQLTKPEFAVISVGADNPYHHPARRIITSLKATGADLYRTDEDGTVVFATDGRRVQVTTER